MLTDVLWSEVPSPFRKAEEEVQLLVAGRSGGCGLEASVGVGLVWSDGGFEWQLRRAVTELLLDLVTSFRDEVLDLLLESGFVTEVCVGQFHFERDVHAFGAVVLGTWNLLGEACVDFDHGFILWSCGGIAGTR